MFKKLTALLAFAVFTMATLTACSINFSDDSDEKDAKITELEQKVADLEKTVKPATTVTDDDAEVKDDTKVDETPAKDDVKDEPKVSDYTGPNSLILSSPLDQADYTTEPIVFAGTVSPNTAKIVVTARTGISIGDNPRNEDIYRLQNFNYGDKTFKYTAAQKYNNLSHGSNEYTFTAYFDDSTTKSVKVTIFYSDPSVAEMGKPVIYLYPEEEMTVYVNVEPTDGISVSEPAIGGGWNVVASPDGKLVNVADGVVYPYLFWEGFAANFETPSEGFVVAKNEVSAFFDEKLSYMGLSAKEIADFKEFWIPRLSEKNFYFITFVPQSTFDAYAPLSVVPAPDTVIRVFFDYKGLDSSVSVPAQTLVKGERKGFTVIEWGGRLY